MKSGRGMGVSCGSFFGGWGSQRAGWYGRTAAHGAGRVDGLGLGREEVRDVAELEDEENDPVGRRVSVGGCGWARNGTHQ